jgi:hypothetical protein
MREKDGGKARETAFGRPQGAEISKCEKNRANGEAGQQGPSDIVSISAAC